MEDGKLFAGGKIRRFRKNLGLTQAQMAEELGLSPSYLNLIERDQRPVSARVLLRLAETFDLDLRQLAREGDAHVVAGLTDMARDPLLEPFELDGRELRAMADDHPRMAEAMMRLYTAYREASDRSADLLERVRETGGTAAALSELPLEEVRDALSRRDNHFAELETRAEAVVSEANLTGDNQMSGLKRLLAERYAVSVRVMPYDVMGDMLRRYDPHNSRLLLSEMLSEPARLFEVAAHVGLFLAKDALDALTRQAKLSSPEAERLYRVSLSKYFAAALLMPYDAFLKAATSVRYDPTVLSRRFSVSFEQVCHRMTTLQRPGARGVAFFLMRVDQAGNVSKRFGGQVFPFARSGGACPRWSLYDAFRTPGRIITQWVELPDGARFFTLARTVRRPSRGPGGVGQLQALALGCHAKDAQKLAYADGMDIDGAPATPIGVTCRLCERANCHQRAHPPLRHKLYVDETRRTLAPFAFRTD